jgi:hypothetical protein
MSAEHKKLPVRPSLEHLRKQAKRLARSSPDLALSQAQHELAREYGFGSWPALVEHVEAITTPVSGGKTLLFRAANDGNLKRLDELLAHQEFDHAELTLALARACLRAPYLPGWREVAERLIVAGADPAGEYGDDYGPILLGCGETLSLEGTRFLLDHGAPAHTDESRSTKYPDFNTPIRMTLGCYLRERYEEKHALISLLLERGARRPADVPEAAFAVFRGETAVLARLLDENTGWVHHRFGRFPYGNMLLHGATLLHLAVEFGEQACIELLIERGADLNARADLHDDLGGQTPVFHAIASIGHRLTPLLEWLLSRFGSRIDLGLRCHGLAFSDDQHLREVLTPVEYAQAALRPDHPSWRVSSPREVGLLTSAAG